MLGKTTLIIFAVLLEGINGYNLTIKTQNGYVKGYEQTSAANKSVTYFAFKGIPYGEPPVGPLRFQDPRPVSSWDGVKEVTDWANFCVVLETSLAGNPVVGSEDCLYLNIYVPKTEKRNEELSLPVMVWYHGGGFVRGGSRPNPSYYIEKPVIIAAVSYRLGIMGFLSTLDENARGNAGLKDQTLGLKWIKNNIRYFGGNPDRITIFGQSAGGASVEYQLISQKSAGLFNQAISQSGSTLNEWGFQENPLELTLKLARRFNITSNDTKQVIAGLQKIDMEVLIKNSQLDGKFLPSVEAESNEAFISQSSYDLWAAGKYHKVPLLIGYNSEEGANNKSK
ncbi:venom carboxylesterase-6-like [Agrilus planipennis]|uniref:Carboxylic ester hydrolase n=1 Tax=Agrilus planipennis TaxID=224129 RepID=A0A7F5R9A0_AGRPL|nr:venom carboxylesterase-6-like [Agrilus planipennis]